MIVTIEDKYQKEKIARGILFILCLLNKFRL